MINYPYFVETKEGHKYKINTDYSVVLECDKITKGNQSDEEKTLAIIFLLFGDEGLNNNDDWEELTRLAVKYIKCNQQETEENEKDIDMDIIQDFKYIVPSFISDYHIDLENTKMHWWKFYELLQGLTEDSILNRVRYFRNLDESTIKDDKERSKIIELKEQIALKYRENIYISEEQERLDKLWEEQLNGG